MGSFGNRTQVLSVLAFSFFLACAPEEREQKPVIRKIVCVAGFGEDRAVEIDAQGNLKFARSDLENQFTQRLGEAESYYTGKLDPAIFREFAVGLVRNQAMKIYEQ
ncbi:MAG: hypothetical protein HC880_11280 [Bacteroidia bacterium]|nr:hypothetical protein [Bacteroidia bacterium]